MNCIHTYPKTWEFGPIIYRQEEQYFYWWFYKKCSKCGEIETFPSWRLNPGPRKVTEDVRDLYMTRQELAK